MNRSVRADFEPRSDTIVERDSFSKDLTREICYKSDGRPIGGTTMPPTSLELPSCDDKRIWDVWMQAYQFPTLCVADDLGLFPLLEKSPMTSDEVATALRLSARATEALVGVLSGLGFLARIDGRFTITEVTRNFLLPSSPYYWGGMLRFVRDISNEKRCELGWNARRRVLREHTAAHRAEALERYILESRSKAICGEPVMS